MKLLLFSDVHCDLACCERLVAKAQTVDVVVGAGDLGNMRKGLESTIAALRSIDKPVVLVPGNSESKEELEQSCQEWVTARVLHASSIELEGVAFFGVGGGIPVTPFGSWSYDFNEQQSASMLEACPQHAVLVTHSPPRGVVDLSSSGANFGSTSILDAIRAKQPRLAVCGHIHECAGKHEMIGNTPVVNAGPEGVIWDLNRL